MSLKHQFLKVRRSYHIISMDKYSINKSVLVRNSLACVGIFFSLFIIQSFGEFLNINMLIAPFGASCAILFCFSDSPFSRPKNMIGGYLISSLIGVVAYHSLGNHSWSVALAVSISVFIMLLSNLMHPPAAAVTIIAITTGSCWSFILFPVFAGAMVITVLAALNNRFIQK